ncbi:thiamine phosphate synthase [Paracoccaceae bacterium]|nr:thiamine phosphate synthase [Paracoccaceae bacterium]
MTAKIYLIVDITSSDIELRNILKNNPIGCVRISGVTELSAHEKKKIREFKELCHRNNLAVLLEDNYEFALKNEFDGVHFTKRPSEIQKVLKLKPKDFLVGVDCSYSKHQGLITAELGVDYISFKIDCNKNNYNSNSYSDNLISWWYETIEIPLVVENVKSINEIKDLSVICDFISIPPIYWSKTSDFDNIVKILN